MIITPKAKLRKEKEVRIGQGLSSTKWKGLNFFILASAPPRKGKGEVKSKTHTPE